MGILKRILFLSSLLILFGVVLFPKEIVLACIKHQASQRCKKEFGAKLEYDAFCWEEGRLICKNGRLVGSDALHATFAQAALEPSISLKKRELAGVLEVRGLHIVHRNKEAHTLPSPPSLPFFKLNLHTTIHGGEVFLYDYMGTSPLFQRLSFDLDHHILGGQTSGSIAIDWGKDIPKLTTYFSRIDASTLRLKTNFQSHSLPDLYSIITYVFHAYLPKPMTHWNVDAGSLNGKLDLELCKGNPLRLKGDISVSNMHADNIPLELIGEVDHFWANLDMDLSSVTTMNGEFFLQGGRLALDETAEFWQGLWDLRNLHTHICVKEGKVESSVLRGNFMGMNGELVLDWHSPDTLMRMGFQGYSKEISTLFPQPYRTNFQEAFADDHFALQAAVNRSGKGLELEGTLSIVGEQEHQLQFGCLFGQGHEEIEWLPETLPISLSRSVDSFLDHLVHQFCLSQKRFGWFSGNQFPLEKFLSPFLLANVRMDITGLADFQGTFDERYLVISYEGEDFHLQSPHFSLHADCVEENADVVAVHYLDLQTWSHIGFLPLRNATYSQNNRDLVFHDAQGMVHFENKHIHIQDVEAYWNQLALKGNLEIEARALDDVELTISAHYLAGPVSDAQQILSRFSDCVFWEIPFQGEVYSQGDVFSFRYHFSPYAELVAGNLQGDFKGYIEQPHLPCEGHVTYDLDQIRMAIQSDLGSFNGLITKDAIILEGKKISLHAERFNEGLHLKDFAYGPWEGTGELEWRGKEIVFHDLLIHEQEKNGEFALSGAYNREDKVWHAALETFHWDFGETHSIWEPKGKIFGSGTIEWKLSEGMQAVVATSFKNLEFGGIHFGDGEDLSCTYSSKKGVTVEGLEVEIPIEKGVEKYKLGRFFYDLNQHKFLLEGFDFSLPPEKLPWVAELASNLFPGKVHPTIVEWLEALKQNEPLEGRISLEIYPENIWVYLSLKDGTYYLSDNQFNFKDFLLLYDPHEFNIWTKVFYQNNDYWIHLLTDSMTMSRGRVEISEQELTPYSQAGASAIVANWERCPETGFCIRNIEGNFHGIQLALNAPEPILSNQIQLEGRIAFDAKRVQTLLNNDLAQAIEHFSISGGYALEGAMTIPKADVSHVSFSGMLAGSDLNCAGIKLASLTSEIEYNPDCITLKNLNVKDWAGQLSLGQAQIIRQMGTWAISCDALKLEDVRLSRLKSPWTQWNPREKSYFRSFFIRNFNLTDFQANLNDPDSFKGTGTLEFTNLPRKTFINNLLFIPTEITARIGLDLTALIPARGTIDYTIADKKIYIKEFKDMYSDGKHSRFYLAEGTTAYVDFGGNLNLKLKMKQYNLLMKLAEFFTITVKGTLLNPHYTFSNQLEDD